MKSGATKQKFFLFWVLLFYLLLLCLFSLFPPFLLSSPSFVSLLFFSHAFSWQLKKKKIIGSSSHTNTSKERKLIQLNFPLSFTLSNPLTTPPLPSTPKFLGLSGNFTLSLSSVCVCMSPCLSLLFLTSPPGLVFPLLILLVASQISGNTGIGAAVLGNIDFVTQNNQTIPIVSDAPVSQFSLWNSVQEMWQAGKI